MYNSRKINLADVKPREDVCGILRELYASEHMSLAHVVVTGIAKKHMHKKMEEVYYVTEGEGKLFLGDDTLEIKLGDTIPIPKDTWHYLIKVPDKQLSVLVITYPNFDPSDVIEE